MAETFTTTMSPPATMHEEPVQFYSDGQLVRGVLKTPDAHAEQPWPIIVHGPGWLETVGHPLSVQFHDGLLAGGYAVLQFDYRGFGASEGERGWVKPYDQQIDIQNAITYVSTRSDLDAQRLGLFAFGGIGGGNAIYVASRDPRVKAICAQTVVADGLQWLREQRREYEWVAFLRRVEQNRLARVLSNDGELVDPTEEIMVATPDRKKKGMPLRGKDFHLASVDYLADFRPVDVAHRLAPCALLLTCIEDDVVTPEQHAHALYEAARPPRRLVIQRGVSHYDAYTVNYEYLVAEFRTWYDRWLRSDVRDLSTDDESVVEITAAASRT